ncbi:MAG: glycosyltransferase family 4 protein [Gemmatimonadota bacterium]
MYRPLDILMVAPQPFFRARGTPVSVLHRTRALQSLGHRVDLLTYPFGDPIDLNGAEVHRSACPPFVKDAPVGPSISKIFLDIPLFREAYTRAAAGAYDLIHTHEEAGVLGALASRNLGIPHLHDMHSSLPQQFSNFERFEWGMVVGAFSRLEQFTLRHAAGVITVYSELRDHVRAVGYRGPLVVIENTQDFDRPPADPGAEEELRRELGLDGKFTVVYTGTLEPYQGMELLMDAGPELRAAAPDLRIVAVGGTAAQIAALRARADGNGNGDLFTFTGPVPPQEVFRYHQVADALITCRIHGTNTPLKIYQYLGSGRPIIATRIDSHTQVLNDEVAELVDPTPRGIAGGIRRLRSDRDRGRQLAEAASELRRNRYSQEAYVETLGAFMEDLTRTLPYQRRAAG